MARVKNIALESARIIFRNFAGKADRFTPAGRRSFGVLIDNETAEELIDEGWHVKWLKAKEEGESDQAYLPVRVNYSTYPPTIYMVTKRKKTLLTEDMISILDNADLDSVDLVISPYCWTMPSKDGDDHGITAYLKTGYFNIVEDAFYEKYAKYDEPMIKDSSDDADAIPFD